MISATYLDAASAEPLHPAAREVLEAALERGWADPRRRHAPGRDARLLLDNARAVVAECLEVEPDEVGFTASGTSAVHRGLLGLTASSGRAGIVHTAVEHSAVLHAVAWREDDAHRGVPVDRTGRVGAEALAVAARAPGVGAVAVQAGNQEIGTLQPVDELDVPPGVPVFVDAAAAVGRVPIPRRWSALAASARKWGGPSGVGVLVVRRGTGWRNPFPGEDTLDESPFPDVPACLAAAAALQAVSAHAAETAQRQHALVDRARASLARVPDLELVGDPVVRLPHLLTFSCLYVAGDELVDALARRGFAVASGSACTASTLEPSHVLAAVGALTHGNVRVSVGRDTVADDVDALCAAVAEIVAEIRAREGL